MPERTTVPVPVFVNALVSGVSMIAPEKVTAEVPLALRVTALLRVTLPEKVAVPLRSEAAPPNVVVAGNPARVVKRFDEGE